MYRIDLNTPTAVTPCTFVPSVAAPGMTLSVNEDGETIVVEPDGSQTRTVPAGDPNWDSAWTQGTVLSGFLVYRSAGTLPNGQPTLGVPRAYRMIV